MYANKNSQVATLYDIYDREKMLNQEMTSPLNAMPYYRAIKLLNNEKVIIFENLRLSAQDLEGNKPKPLMEFKTFNSRVQAMDTI